ncbi:ectoine/hydroxyectoine ABC transporter permease subunit EhuD [Actinomadura luteofluorescens]|uniref:ectoine/hydroxyectoine ABC transporter permease subunit EhuD n=1 Tax=Actinomadura luteofluorescens TaxID=46163 RepID=UPI0036355220
MSWDWHYSGEILPDLLNGLRYTLTATLLGYVIALVLGLVWTLLRRSPSRVFNQVVRWVTEFIRSTPLIPQLYFVFFVLLGLGRHHRVPHRGHDHARDPLLDLHGRGVPAGIADVPKGQWEACTALNLPRSRVWLDVVLPQAIRRVIPTLGNYLIAMFKDSPMLLAINVAELLFSAYQVGSKSLQFLEPITMVGLLFVVVSVISSILVRRLERRYATN